MATSAAGAAAALSAEQLAEVLRTVKDGMREEMTSLKGEMASLKREIAGDREAADERLLKKIKLEKAPTFKKKLHEKQFQFNEEVACKLDSASASLSVMLPNGLEL